MASELYCPKCLPQGPKPAGVSAETGQALAAFERYFCTDHNQVALLYAKQNGAYECHCGWKSESQVDLASRIAKLEAQVAKLGKAK